MSHLPASSITPPRRALASTFLALVAILALGLGGLSAIYALAQGLTWQFDDHANLKELAGASSLAGVLNFVFGGGAGPLGRSLSLLTFLANYDDWPNNPWGMVQITFAFHLMNGALVFLLSQRILISRPLYDITGKRALWLALAVAILWLWLPIHASGVLIPVQRMTHVSAFFALVSLYGYMVIRQRQHGRVPSVAGCLGISFWLAITIIAAAFAKENGVVAITFVFLLEIIIFYPQWRRESTNASDRLWRAWVALAGCAVATVILVHVALHWTTIRASFELYRGYSWSEHVATQWVISLEYFRQIVIPRSALLGPFHDGHTVYDWSDAAVYAAIAFWCSLLWGASWFGRRGAKASETQMLGWAGCGAVLWFFAGHQVESTLIPLELYFEHRNYLASLGFCVWLVLAFDQFLIRARNKIVPCLVISAYCSYMAFSLFQITSLWGHPLLANDLWQKSHPRSTRAAQTVLTDLMRTGYQDAAFDFADDFIKERSSLDVAIQMMALRCEFRSEAEQSENFKQLKQLVAEMKNPGGIPTGLAAFGNAVRHGGCHAPSADQYDVFLMQLLAHPRVEQTIKVRHHVYYEMAQMAEWRDDAKNNIEYLKRAFWDYPSLSVAQLVAVKLFEEQRLEEAINWIDSAIDSAPNVSLRKAWRDTLQSMRDALYQIQQSLSEVSPQRDITRSPSQ